MHILEAQMTGILCHLILIASVSLVDTALACFASESVGGRIKDEVEALVCAFVGA